MEMGEGLRYDKKRKTENEGEPGDVFKKEDVPFQYENSVRSSSVADADYSDCTGSV